MASQEAELTFKNQNIEALITKIGMQTEKVRNKREAADVEAQKVRCHILVVIHFYFCSFHTSHHLLHYDVVMWLIVADFVQVSVIQAEVSVKQKDCENDLAKAEPSLAAATAALDTLNKVLSSYQTRHNSTTYLIII